MSEEEPRPAHELEPDEPATAAPERDGHGPAERRRRPVADWGGDELFNQVPRRRFARAGVGAHTRRPSPSPITSHQLRRNADFAGVAPLHGAESRPGGEPVGTPAGPHTGDDASLITIHEPSGPGGVLLSERNQPSYAARERRRARRTVDQRVGPRPDRIAALAFVLGLLLVLLAVATADASVLPAA